MTDLQPCSPCREGNHDSCEALGSPFCGCRRDQHHGALAGPVVAPFSEVLAAGQRAPQPEMAQLPATPAEPVAPAPTGAPSLVDQVMGQLGTVLGVPPATMGERTIELDDLAPDDDPDEAPLAAVPDRGQAGLPDQPGPATPEHPAPASPEMAPPDAAAATSGDLPPTYDSIPMVAERDPALYASVWDSGQAHFASEVDPNQDAIEDAQDFGPDEDLNGMAGFPGSDVTAPPEHTYAGTPEAPYACACGTNPGTLNKLGSHLGIVADVDAMAELGKATVPNLLAASATVPESTKTPVPAPEAQPDGIDTAGLGQVGNVPTIEGLGDERAAGILSILLSHGITYVIEWADEGTTVKLVLGDREAGPYPVAELPEALPLLTYLNGYDATVEALEALPDNVTITGDLVGAVEQAVTAADVAQALEELPAPTTDLVTPEPGQGAVDIYQDDDVRTMATVADAVRDRLASQPATAELLDSGTPWRLVLVNGETGMVWEALYDDDQLPTLVADALLEHFGFAPSPIDAEHPPVPPQARPAPAQTISGTGMAGLPGPDTTRPTRVQVARIATECAACHQTIEPGEMIGYFPGTGWRHLSHG